MKMRAAYCIRAFAIAILSVLCLSSAQTQTLTSWPKWQLTRGNTGWNSFETALTTANVNQSTFGKIWTRRVDGEVYAQPLYVANVEMPRVGRRNILYVATSHNFVYAFDADSNQGVFANPYWVVRLGQPVSAGVVGSGDIDTFYGITSTPVIDVGRNTMYLCPKTYEFLKQTWRLHALDIRTGKPKPNWGFEVRGTVLGDGGGSVNGVIAFNPDIQFSRAGLTLANNRVYVTFGSHGDQQLDKYHGWIFGYNVTDPRNHPQVWNSSPDTNVSGQAANGIWMAGASPAVDDDGNLIFITGNGYFDSDLGGRNVGDSIVRLNTASGDGLFFTADIGDVFTPSNQADLQAFDIDEGSGGVMLLPQQDINDTGTPNLLVGGGKGTGLHLLDRDFFGGFTGRSDPTTPNNALANVFGWEGGFWSTASYWGSDAGNYVYMQSVGGPLRQLRVHTDITGRSTMDIVGVATTSTSYPSSTPTISSNAGTAGTGIAWLLNRATNALYAYDASDVSQELFNSNQYFGRDSIGGVLKFTIPIVANGKVFVGGIGKVFAFGLNPPIVTTPDHFKFSGSNVVNNNVPVSFQLSALDSNGNVMAITRNVKVWLRQPNGNYVLLNTQNFNADTHKTWLQAYTMTGRNQLVIERGTPLETSFTFFVRPIFRVGADYFVVTVSGPAQAGQAFNYTVTAKDATGNDVAFTGTVKINFARENGTVQTDQGSVTFSNQTSVTGSATLTDTGTRILIASDGARTGTIEFTVTP